MLCAFAPERRVRPNWHMFFMGAGFMLLETKGVVHLALLFGSTWLVNSIVFFAILVMILCSNLWVLAVRPARLWPYYLLLACSLDRGDSGADEHVSQPARRVRASWCRARSSSCRCSSPA